MAARLPVFRISFRNATVLSGAYLATAVSVELVRRFTGAAWAEAVSGWLDKFPAVVLRMLRLLGPLRDAYQEGRLSGSTVRVAYGLTVVAVIFAMGLLVGLVMWVIGRTLTSADPS